MPFSVDQEVAGYRILRVLGEGGMGVVYHARDIHLDRDVALKVVRPAVAADSEMVKRFQREARALARMKSRHIVGIHEMRDTPDGLFIVMEFVAGGDLADRLKEGPIPALEALAIMAQLLEALEMAHQAGIVHRDIKPQNVLVSTKGVAKLTDFGLAKLTDPATIITIVPGVMGTMYYMSPEQVRAEVLDHRTDIWSLGVVLYEMLTGRRPFNAAYEAAVMYSITNLELDVPDASMPPDVEALVRKALQKDREKRYASAAEMLEAIRAVQHDSGTGGGEDEDATPEPAHPDEERAVAVRRRKAFARPAIVGLAALTMGAAAYILYLTTGAEEQAEIGASAPALLSLSTVPEGAEVTINDQSIGRSPVSAIRLGTNESAASVSLRLEGFLPVDTVLQAGGVHEIVLTEAPAERRTSVSPPRAEDHEPQPRPGLSETPRPVSATVAIAPSDGASFRIDGGPSRSPGAIELLPGSHTITIQSERYGRFEDRISVAAGSQPTIECYFEREVRITSGATWATVLDNGKPVLRDDGTPETTPVELTLGPGEHQISLLKHGFEARLVGGAPGPITITPSCETAEPYALLFELRPN